MTGLLEEIFAEVSAGRQVLLLGPVGIGKTRLLGELERQILADGRSCGRSTRTETMADILEALRAAYHLPVMERRRLRGRLRRCVEEGPGALLLDHVGNVGTAARGFLRSLRGTGLGVVFACDVLHPRDHARVRRLRLTHRELVMPSLARAALRRLLDERLVGFAVEGRTRERLVAAAQGRPGRIERFARLIGAGMAPSHVSLLRAAALAEEACLSVAWSDNG